MTLSFYLNTVCFRGKSINPLIGILIKFSLDSTVWGFSAVTAGPYSAQHSDGPGWWRMDGLG